MTPTNDLEELAVRLDGDGRVIHPHGCDCEGCWIGYSVNEPKPPTLWQRIIARAKAQSPNEGEKA